MNPSSSSSLEVSPLSVRGQERLARLRASIRQQFGGARQQQQPAGEGAAAATQAPRAKIRQRLARAAQMTTDEIFFREFGSPKQLAAVDFALARPPPPASGQQQQQPPFAAAAFGVRTRPVVTAATRGRAEEPSRTRSHFPPDRRAAQPAAERPAAYVSQLQRPAQITTPKKASLKRLRSADEPPSAEKPAAQKPRLLSDVTSTFNNRSFRNVGQARGVGAAFASSSPVRKVPGFPRPPSRLQQPSPSKFRSTAGAQLLAPRQTASYR